MGNNIVYVIGAGVLGLIFAFWKKSWIETQDEGTDQVQSEQDVEAEAQRRKLE